MTAAGRTGSSTLRLERLSAQARLLEPFTRRMFEDAGIGPDMRVLDVGCGHGDVTLLAAEYVGPSGEMAFAEPFDAVVGRAVLGYVEDPVQA